MAVVGEIGFGKVVAVGEYLLEKDTNLAEIAFSVSKEWQHKGLGKILMKKLSEAAKKNNISGLVAYVAPHNKPMLNLFKGLPYKIKTVTEENMITLSCRFDEAGN